MNTFYNLSFFLSTKKIRNHYGHSQLKTHYYSLPDANSAQGQLSLVQPFINGYSCCDSMIANFKQL